ncbi:MAG: polysaccharide deacetylase family protein [Pseudomonadota bacterium]
MTSIVLKRFGLIFFAVLLGPAHAGAAETEKTPPREIALTFDDAPRPDGVMFTGSERTRELIKALREANVTGAMFFANSDKLDKPAAVVRLRQYAEAGHDIANHSHSHPSANRVTPEVFLADVAEAHQVLSRLPSYVPLFRYPYLHEGRPRERRDAIVEGLKELGLSNGYVTIDNYDWYLEALLGEQRRLGITFDRDAWREVYLSVLMQGIEFYDRIAVETLGRSPRHVLLLHENDLAALFIGDLVKALREAGWRIIPAMQAYEDPIAAEQPDTLFLGQGRVAALAQVAGAPARWLVHRLENEAVLRAELVRRSMLPPATGSYLGEASPGLDPQVFAPGVVSLPDQYEYGSVFSADGREMFFGVALGGRDEIRVTRFDGERWTPPEVVLSDPKAGFNDPMFSPDQSRLYFITTRAANGVRQDTYDIGYIERRRDGWSDPRLLPAPVNTAGHEYYASFTNLGTLAFASTMHTNDLDNPDLYLAAGVESRSEVTVTQLPESVNSPSFDADPFIAADGSYLIFSSTRAGGEGRGDLYVTFRREDASWGDAVPLGPGINTAGHELCPFVTLDGRYLFYTSNEDIYWVSSEVLTPLRRRSIEGESDKVAGTSNSR